MLVKLAAALLFFWVLDKVVGSDNIDIYDSLPEKPVIQKGRLSLQNTGRRCVSVCYKNVDCRLVQAVVGFVRTRVSEAGEELSDSSIPEFLNATDHQSQTRYLLNARRQNPNMLVNY